MKEIFGQAMGYYKRRGFILCVTTNGFLKKDGTGVMGRGIALQVTEEDSTLPALLGKSLQCRGNVVSRLTPEILTFPTKHVWMQDADPKLIVQSAIALKEIAEKLSQMTFILPRPGCGNGGLKWENVKPLLEAVNLPENVWIIGKWEERPKHV